MYKLDLEKSEEPEIKSSTLIHSSKKQESSRKNICFIDYTKTFDCVDHNKLWKILEKVRISDHLTYLLRNLYAGQEATVRTKHGKTDWFKIRKGVCQPCLPAAAVAAKSLQSCPTLCDPMGCSLPVFSVHGILQARIVEWVAISFL